MMIDLCFSSCIMSGTDFSPVQKKQKPLDLLEPSHASNRISIITLKMFGI